jgi:LacI family transcriptional regulator
MADVARVAGVSKQTVSRVINNRNENSEETRQRVLEVIARLDYRPHGVARSLATSKTMTFGLILPNLTNTYFTEVAVGAEEAALVKGYTMLISNTFVSAEQEASMLTLFEQRGVDGIIMDNPLLPDGTLIPLLQRHRAAVLIGRKVHQDNVATITVDDAYGAELAIRHLVSRGRRAIALINALPDNAVGRKRKQGYLAGLKSAGLPCESGYIVHCNPGPSVAYEQARALLERQPEIDALLCYNDMVAIAAIRACYNLGRRVPEDIAIIGHDDILMTDLIVPSLTTLRVSKYDLGVNAVRLLFDLMEGRNQNTEMILTPELLVRESAP